MALIRAFARASPGGEAIGPNSGTRGSREASSLDDQTRVRRFESFFVPHLYAAYNFARWLTRDERNAEDMVQEACLRAFKFIDSFHGEDGRAWLLGIVRNTYYTWLKRNKVATLAVPFDEESFDAARSRRAAIAAPARSTSSSRKKTQSALSTARSSGCQRSSARRSYCASWKASRTRKSPPSRAFRLER